ncbi:MAG: hypothetical protein AW07_04766 [Candidatus Accumulibacter sp. SK-11]|nr:MAG: hypothetical protein AW07_04766 [Candidatus Accumulibacter sp. SK-11]
MHRAGLAALTEGSQSGVIQQSGGAAGPPQYGRPGNGFPLSTPPNAGMSA